MLVIAHRGASGYAPEHSFAAWDLALAQGADYLEQDLQLTADGVLVVMHDDTLDRTARSAAGPATGRIAEHTLPELAGLEVGSWFNQARPALARSEYQREPIPTLDRVLARYADRASFYIETKQPEAAPGMEEALLGLLGEYRLLVAAEREWRVLVQSFSEASLRKLHRLQPGLPLIRLLERGELADGDLAAAASYAVGIGPHHEDVTPALVAAAHQRCLCVHPYTVNRPADQARLAAAGVDGMFTDFPDRLLATRPTAEPRGLAAVRAAAAAHARCVSARAAGAASP
jgi:glycerophosphoryl diester phosphodiesterase